MCPAVVVVGGIVTVTFIITAGTVWWERVHQAAERDKLLIQQQHQMEMQDLLRERRP